MKSDLGHQPFPVYLGVNPDCTLSFIGHITKLKGKLILQNNCLSKLATTNWGTDPKTLRQTALALLLHCWIMCPSMGKIMSCHKVDLKLHKSCRIITGTLKSTSLPALYIDLLASPSIHWTWNNHKNRATQTIEWPQAPTLWTSISEEKTKIPQKLPDHRTSRSNQCSLLQTGKAAGMVK